MRKNNENNEGLQNETLYIPSKWLNEQTLSQNWIKIYFENMKGGTLIFFCPLLALAKGGKPVPNLIYIRT